MNQLQPYQGPFLPAKPAETESDVSLRRLIALTKPRRKKIALVMFITALVSVVILLIVPKRWTSEAQVVVTTHQTTNTEPAAESYEPPLVEDINTQMGMMSSDTMTYKTLAWINSRPEAKKIYHKYDPGQSFDSFQADYTFTNPINSNVILIDAGGWSPSSAHMKCEALSESFMTWTTDLARRDVNSLIDSLTQRESPVESELKTAEQDLADYRSAHKIVDSTTQDKAVLDELAQVAASLDISKQKLASQTAHVDTLRSQLNEVTGALGTSANIRDDTLLLSLQTQLTTAEVQRANDAQQYTAKYPGILPQLDAQIADLKRRIASMTAATVLTKNPSLQTQSTLLDTYDQALVEERTDQADYSATSIEYNALTHQLAMIPAVDTEYNRLSRSVTMLTALYTSLVTDLNEAKLDRDKTNPDVVLAQIAIKPPVGNPSFPKLKIIIAVALLMAIIAGALSVVVDEYKNPVVRDVDRIRSLVPGYLIGTMPNLNRKQLKEIAGGESPMVFSEMYSLAFANMSMAMRQLLAGEPGKHAIVLVTSGLPGEGKSTVAAQIARTVANAGRRTILINADMIKPAAGGPLKIPGQIGFANVLEGTARPADVLTPTDIPNLTIVTNGKGTTNNRIELLSRPSTVAALNAFRDMADMVVIDTPASSLVADALLLAPHADCILHVIGAGKVSEAIVRDSISALESAAPNRMFFLINNAPAEQVSALKSYHHSGDYGRGADANGTKVVAGK